MKTKGSDVVATVLAAAAVLLLQAWLVMLMVGWWHAGSPGVPAISFRDSVFLVVVGRQLATVPTTTIGAQRRGR